jgi:hypothetical protein
MPVAKVSANKHMAEHVAAQLGGARINISNPGQEEL